MGLMLYSEASVVYNSIRLNMTRNYQKIKSILFPGKKKKQKTAIIPGDGHLSPSYLISAT